MLAIRPSVVAIIGPSRFGVLVSGKAGAPVSGANLEYVSHDNGTTYSFSHRTVVSGVNLKSTRQSEVVRVWRIVLCGGCNA